MSYLEIILIAISLAMDSFALSVTSGMILKKYNTGHFIRIAFYMGFFQAIMPVLGWFLGVGFKQYIVAFDHWIAFGLLLFLGIKMIYEDLHPDKEANFDPIKRYVLLGLALATSIDALVIGVNFAFLGVMILEPVIIIGITAFIFSFLGAVLGCRICHRIKLRALLVGGIILIGLGIKILIEHLTV